VINKMNPANTLSLIRDGINPLEISMEELEAKLDDHHKEAERSVESYAAFICRMDRAGNISEEERASFIGIYRLLDKIDKSDGKALGDLVKSGSMINFKNLLCAVRTGKSKGIDVKLDDSVGEVIKAAGYKYDISEQIAAGFENVLNSKEGSEEYIRREFEEYKNILSKDEKDAQKELEYLDEKITPQNLNAMARILANDKDYNPWKKLEELSRKLEDEDLSNAIKNLPESFEDEESAAKAYENVYEEAKAAIGRISESSTDDYLDIRSLKNNFRQIGLISKMTAEENYEVPVEMGEESFNIRLKIMRKAEKEGKVFTSFESAEFGNILAQISVNDGVLSALVACDSALGSERLKAKIDFEESYKKAGFEEVTFNFIQTDIINVDYFRQHYVKGSSDEVTTKQLYNIAKTFIQTVKKAGNDL